MSYSTINATAVNVANFGARGDGVHENRAVIQAAINNLYPKGGGSLFFPRGTYYFSGTVDVTGNYISFIGEEGATLLAFADESRKKINISGGKYITFDNLTFNANRTGTSHSSNQLGFISTLNSENINIRNCKFYNTRNSLIYLGAGTKFATVTNNYFTGHFCGIYGYINSGELDSEKFLITDNAFDKTWVGAVNESACVKLQTQPNPVWTGVSRGHVISNNIINSTCQMGIELWSIGRDNIVSNNTITNTAWGVSLDNQENTTVVGNTIKGVSFMGIECATICKNISIGNNTINGYTGYLSSGSRITQYGVSTSNATCEKIIYNANIIEGCNIGINIQNTLDTIISNNIIKDCGNSLFFQGASRSQVYGNLFETGNKFNVTSYHIFFDASSVNLSGFHISNNKFRGKTTDQSIFYYTNSNSSRSINNVFIENNVTDESTKGGFDIFIGGQTTPINYIYRNNMAPSGADGSNSIQDASDSTNPYKNTDIAAGYQYYGTQTWTVPALEGITGDGLWLCLWSGGLGIMNHVRARIFNVATYNNNSTDLELWASMVPYQSPAISHSLVSPSVGVYDGNISITQAKTISHDAGTATNSIWVKLRPTSTGAGKTFNINYSADNNLSTPYTTYVEPLDTQNNAKLYFDPLVNHPHLFKSSFGFLVGNSAGLKAISSGVMSVVGDLQSAPIRDFGATSPSTPSNGGITFVSGGALYYIGSAGTITKLANA